MQKHPIELLQLNKRKENQFIDKGLTTVEDVAFFFPRRYIDFRQVALTKDVLAGNYYTLFGTVVDIRDDGSRYVATVEEDKELIPGYRVRFSVIWFGTDYYIKKLTLGVKYYFCGKVTEFRGSLQMNAPLGFGQDAKSLCTIMPVYSKIQGMSKEYLLTQIDAALQYLQVNDRVGEKELFAKSLNLMPKYAAAREIHQPTDALPFRRAKERMAFEDIYDFYSDMKQKDLYLIGTSIQSIERDVQTQHVIANLPFALTSDQQSVMNTIIQEARAGNRIHSIISGDVGCGKTMMALLSSIFMWENGYQTILMAPTLVLAQQHYQEFLSYAQSIGMEVGLLTTETKKKERDRILTSFSNGTLDILIGTHALLSGEIVPYRLGLTIIDEEHKFGVKQKARLEEYDKAGIHHLSMTATPIPRSIALTVYGNGLAVLPIRTMPKGRKPVITNQCPPQEAFEKMYEEILLGHQGYIICPFIEDSESTRFQDIISIASAKKMADDYFSQKPTPVRIGVISGDMKQKDILSTVSRFAAKEFDILISTTIVEVGVNIPNASVITIMSAERFGLAALHQLRGRVGRGPAQSYCLLCSQKMNSRLDVMCAISDGFAIAEQDMRLRGPGDLTGDAQSGDSKVIDLILQRPKLSEAVRRKFFPPA